MFKLSAFKQQLLDWLRKDGKFICFPLSLTSVSDLDPVKRRTGISHSPNVRGEHFKVTSQTFPLQNRIDSYNFTDNIQKPTPVTTYSYV